MRFRGWLRLGSWSLKLRLGLIFASFMGLTVVLVALTLLQQHRLSTQSTQLAVAEHAELERIYAVREGLTALESFSIIRSDNLAPRAAEVREALGALSGPRAAPEERQAVRRAREQVEAYLDLITSQTGTNRALARARFEEAAAAVNALAELKQVLTYRTAHNLAADQKRFIRNASLILLVFVVLLTAGALRIIAFVTEPLSALSRSLDEVNVEDDLPKTLPATTRAVPEIATVARSFEQLLARLQGYRALNVKRLLIEKRRADVIAASTADGIFLLRGSELLYVNPVGERIVGLAKGRSWRGLNLQAGGETETAGIRALRTAISRTIPVEHSIDVEEGRKLHYLIQAYPIPAEVIEEVEDAFSGPIDQLLDRWQANLMIVARDVTLVRESQEAKSHFIATLSHEVKTPVTSLTMATRLLKRSVEQFASPTHRALIQTCAEDVDRLRGLIEDLLSVSRFDSLTQKLEMKRVNVFKLLKQSVQFFQPEAFERGVEIIMHMPPDGSRMMVAMDASKISWALSNLMVNALRHAPRGGKVEVSMDFKDHLLEVRIRDNGPGIDRSRQEKIFEKFNPFYNLRVARSGSVGMGLAIAREIVVAHGGTIGVSSEPDKGAEFFFTLPIERSAGGGSGLTVANAVKQKGEHSGASARS